jgi:hypothetical protein
MLFWNWIEGVNIELIGNATERRKDDPRPRVIDRSLHNLLSWNGAIGF